MFGLLEMWEQHAPQCNQETEQIPGLSDRNLKVEGEDYAAGLSQSSTGGQFTKARLL